MGKTVPKPNKNASPIPKFVPQPKVFRAAEGEGCLRIRMTSVDVGGPWCLTKIDPGHFADLLPRLKSFEQMKTKQVFGQGSTLGKTYEVAKIPNPDALKRLMEINLDDQTEIARLEITGRRRLYGFISEGSDDFWALWWDPEHEIWPSKLKRT